MKIKIPITEEEALLMYNMSRYYLEEINSKKVPTIADDPNLYFIIGWMWGEFCGLLDSGVDVREIEIPALCDQLIKDTREQCISRVFWYKEDECEQQLVLF